MNLLRPFRIFLLLLLVSSGVNGLRAQNNVTSTVNTTDTGSRPAPRDTGPIGSRNPFGQTFSSEVKVRLLPVFFPPPAPVLGAELPRPPAVRDSIWTDLAPYTNELFYAQLGTRFSENDLNRRVRQRLEVYRAARTTALTDLRGALAQPPGADRAAALSTLAQRQDPSLATLATQADQLRRELYQGGFLAAGADWNEHRNWRLGDTDSKRTPQESLYDEFAVLRAAIFFQEGLSTEQRQLLREIVIELAESLGERDALPLSDSFDPEPVIFFLPHGSRLRLPGNLPAPVLDEINAFTAAKAALKRELREALFTLDREGSGKREKSLQELAAQQAPRLAALEPVAERIRLALAQAGDTGRSSAPAGLSPELAARLDRYLREKSEVQRAAQQQAQASSKETSPAASRAALAEFEARNRARLAALATEARAIRDEVARLASANADGAPKSVDALLADFMGAFKQQQLQSVYVDYRTAVLAPGLSPAQRQLLFDAALAGFDLTGVKDWQAVPD